MTRTRPPDSQPSMLSIHQNVIKIVQAKFLSAEEIVKCIHLNVSLKQEDWIEAHRILALVEFNLRCALFVFVSENPLPTAFSDLTIERAIPIDKYFSCDTELKPDSREEIFFNINYRKLKLQFCIEIGSESANFASELIKAEQAASYSKDDFHWLKKYVDYKDGSEMDEGSPDIQITRQRISSGQSISRNRDSILRGQLKLKEAEYLQQQEFTIFVGTWNVNGQPPSIPLKTWLTWDEDPPDVYAIGFQELDLSKEAFLFNDSPRGDEWQKAVLDGLHPAAKYRQVAITRLVGMQLVVMLNVKHYQHIKNVAVDTVGTGLLGKIGNKGGVVIRFELHNTSLCFVNCHLAAHVEEFERRNQDYNDINTRVIFKKNPQSIKDHNQVYWLGDLNYRVTELPNNTVKRYVADGNLDGVLKYDQLNQQKALGKVLYGYSEGDITFKPTYKFDLHTDIYDTSEKARAPAWTDRILWRGKGIDQLVYKSHMDIQISDHKPVSALFRSEINVVDQSKYRKVHEKLLKELDKLENEYLPQVTVDQTEVIFDLVKFKEPQYRDIIIANTGMIPAEFKFINKLDDKNFCKDWLRITPSQGCINVGEKCDVRLEVNLETNLEKIYDILVLHLEDGKDMFITVMGDCQRTCFTCSISTLCRASVPILHLSPEQLKHAENCQSPVLYSIPRELWLLVDNLYRNGLKTRELFENSALHDEFIQIRDWLDRGSLDPIPGSIYAIAEALLLFLSYTKDPIIPYHLHESCIAASSNYMNCRQIIQQKLPDLERNIFLYLCMFLQELTKHTTENGCDARTIATLFGDIILRDPIRNSKPQTSRGKANFIYHFLVNDQSSLIIPNK